MADKAQDKLQELFISYGRALPEKIAEIENDWKELNKEWNNEIWETLHRKIHTICGTAGTYGYTIVSQSARELEIYVKDNMGAVATDDQRREIEAFLTKLKEAVQLSSLDNQQMVLEPEVFSDQAQKQVYLFTDDDVLVRGVMTQLRGFGYLIKSYSEFDSFKSATNEIQPSAIIADITNMKPEELEYLSKIQKKYGILVPIIFVSDRSDLLTRLEAVRAGGVTFFVKPIEFTNFAHRLDQLCGVTLMEPYRILIVDDSPQLADYFSLILKQSGMLTAVVNDPLTVTETLVDFKPDLILMDIYMPGCNGLELAAILRQEEVYTNVPIVFLTTETSEIKQQYAMSIGGDDFITKPVRPEYLVTIVKSRVEHSRTLRSFMVKDALTGIYTQAAFEKQIEIEIARSEQYGLPFSLGLIDLDNFKIVNDTYGHMVGNQVIKSLSSLLQNHLSKTDILGRYGGEKIGVILSGVPGIAASKQIDSLRIQFSRLKHYVGGQLFTVSFSAGIASYPICRDVLTLTNTVTEALFQAKQAGRNKIVLAEEILE
ncbi:MAG: diguanylate cyclase [Gammaproteobacteria bacterium]